MWNLKKKKTLVVGISQQLYIEKALPIRFQGENKKKERKEKSPNPKLKHQPYTPLDTYIRAHTKVGKKMKPPWSRSISRMRCPCVLQQVRKMAVH